MEHDPWCFQAWDAEDMCICTRLRRARADERELGAQAIEAERERYIVGVDGAIGGWSSPAQVYTHAASLIRKRDWQ